MTTKGLISKSKIDAIKAAIRAKGAGSTSMTLDQMATAIGTIGGGGGTTPSGTISITENGTYDVAAFASAAVNVPSGGGSGGWSTDGIASNSEPSGALTLGVASVLNYAFYRKSAITSVRSTTVTSVADDAFGYCSNLLTVFLPNAYVNISSFEYCSALASAVIKSTGNYKSTVFRSCTSLAAVDFTGDSGMSSNAFNSCSALQTLIMRGSSVTTLQNTTAFNGTPFASGGSGGTIYVPSALIDSYKAHAQWSVLDGYGTVTWAAIEGSIYETQYADGTPIS